MGIISNKCCRYNTNEEALRNLEGKDEKNKLMIGKLNTGGNVDMSENMSLNSHSVIFTRRVTFSTLVEQRNFHCDEEQEYGKVKFEDIQKDPQLSQIHTDEVVTNISFEQTENNFVIEDCFYKVPHKLKKSAEEIKIKNVSNQEQEKLRNMISEILKQVYRKNNRVDGILYIPNSNSLIILTEFNIYEFKQKESNYILNRNIVIQEIDFMTITRDGEKLILHLIENKTYVINFKKLEKVAACICATYFYDKSGPNINSDNINRHISVIIINENFEISTKLEKISDFFEYKENLNYFLKSKLNDINVDTSGPYKYVSVKFKNEKEMEMKSADFFIFREYISLYRYDGSKLNEVYKIQMKNMTKLVPNRKNNCLKIFDKYIFRDQGLEIYTESFGSLLILIDEIVKSLKKVKNSN